MTQSPRPDQPPALYVVPSPPAAPPGPACRACGARPAIAATARAHRGLVIVMQFRSIEGPFCRDCGISVVRRLSEQTLWQGWWSPVSLFVAPVVLGLNLVLRIRFDRLPAPVRAAGAALPMDPGRPLFLRPAILGILVPIALVVAVAIAVVDAAAGR